MSEQIDPGEGYRLLANGEIICKGDEWFQDGIWERTYSTGQKVGTAGDYPYRRKIAGEDRWIPLSERLPDKFPCQLVYEGKVFIGITKGGAVFRVEFGTLRINEVTHWKPLKLSAPPEPEVSEEEKAFEEFAKSRELPPASRHNARCGWLAALDYARKTK